MNCHLVLSLRIIRKNYKWKWYYPLHLLLSEKISMNPSEYVLWHKQLSQLQLKQQNTLHMLTNCTIRWIVSVTVVMKSLRIDIIKSIQNCISWNKWPTFISYTVTYVISNYRQRTVFIVPDMFRKTGWGNCEVEY